MVVGKEGQGFEEGHEKIKSTSTCRTGDIRNKTRKMAIYKTIEESDTVDGP